MDDKLRIRKLIIADLEGTTTPEEKQEIQRCIVKDLELLHYYNELQRQKDAPLKRAVNPPTDPALGSRDSSQGFLKSEFLKSPSQNITSSSYVEPTPKDQAMAREPEQSGEKSEEDGADQNKQSWDLNSLRKKLLAGVDESVVPLSPSPWVVIAEFFSDKTPHRLKIGIIAGIGFVVLMVMFILGAISRSVNKSSQETSTFINRVTTDLNDLTDEGMLPQPSGLKPGTVSTVSSTASSVAVPAAVAGQAGEAAGKIVSVPAQGFTRTPAEKPTDLQGIEKATSQTISAMDSQLKKSKSQLDRIKLGVVPFKKTY